MSVADFWRVAGPWFIPMGLLILASAFFSGSEAALFSLRPHDRRALRRTSSLGRAADDLLEEPERLLSVVLFWNLLINIVYFAIASIVGGRLSSTESGSAAAIVFTIGSVLTIIFFSEMLPKSLGVVSPVRYALFVARPLEWSVSLIAPILPLLRGVNTICSRIIWPGFEPESELDLADIERAIQLGETVDPTLTAGEGITLAELVRMADVRVTECMLPRSRFDVYPPDVQIDDLTEGIPEDGFLYLSGADDDATISSRPELQVAQAIDIDLLRPSQLDDLAGAAEPVVYVPWSATVSDALDHLLTSDHPVAVVVNEFGDTIGVVSMDDIMHQMLAGEVRRNANSSGTPSVEKINENEWRVSGTLSLRQLIRDLEIESDETLRTTVSGWMQRQNERIPMLGDTCMLGDFQLRVIQQSDDDDDAVILSAERIITLPQIDVNTPTSSREPLAGRTADFSPPDLRPDGRGPIHLDANSQTAVDVSGDPDSGSTESGSVPPREDTKGQQDHGEQPKGRRADGGQQP